jgi:hypothetical protein
MLQTLGAIQSRARQQAVFDFFQHPAKEAFYSEKTLTAPVL